MTSRRRGSLIIQLLIGIGLPLAGVLIIVGSIAFVSARDEIAEVYDSHLITSANELWLLSQNVESRTEIQVGGREIELDDKDQKALDEYAKWRTFRVWRDGKLLLVSDNLASRTAPAAVRGFSNVTNSLGDWRVFALYVPKHDVIVEISEKIDARNEIVRPIMYGLLVPLLLALPLFALVIWLGGRWGLRDLRRFAATIGKRSPDDLSHIAAEGAPAEVAPLADAINQLLVKLERALEQERLFTDNAAHELRTPLATLGLQMDVLRNAKTATERRATLSELDKGVARAARLLDQLLTLARIRHTPIEAAPLDLHAFAADSIRDIYPLARAKGIELSLVGDDRVEVVTKKPLLAILVRNLLDNAIKYAPAGTRVEMTLAWDNSGVALSVADQGPGIPEAERQRVFARFYRLKDAGGTGSGLGLAIVRTIADLLGVSVTLMAAGAQMAAGDQAGLRAEVRWLRLPAAE